MLIEKTNADSATIQTIGHTTELTGQSVADTLKRQGSANTFRSDQRETQQLSVIGTRHAAMAKFNQVARSVRIVDQSMGKIATQIDRMKEQLTQLIKQFPPFPPGSEEKIRHLRNFNGLREIIDQLTVPPKEKYAQQLMADPKHSESTGDWEISIGADGTAKKIHRQQVHSGASGLDIPALPENADDEMIHAAFQNLDQAKARLESKRLGLARDVERIKAINSASAWKGAGASVSEQKSHELQQTLSDTARVSLTQAPDQLKLLLF
jgi:hypothetical protein